MAVETRGAAVHLSQTIILGAVLCLDSMLYHLLVLPFQAAIALLQGALCVLTFGRLFVSPAPGRLFLVPAGSGSLRRLYAVRVRVSVCAVSVLSVCLRYESAANMNSGREEICSE